MAGGNVFMMYSTTIFNEAHAEESTAFLGTIMAGVTAVIGAALFAFFVDSKERLLKIWLVLGRKAILVLGTIILSASLAALGVTDFTRVFVVFQRVLFFRAKLPC